MSAISFASWHDIARLLEQLAPKVTDAEEREALEKAARHLRHRADLESAQREAERLERARFWDRRS